MGSLNRRNLFKVLSAVVAAVPGLSVVGRSVQPVAQNTQEAFTERFPTGIRVSATFEMTADLVPDIGQAVWVQHPHIEAHSTRCTVTKIVDNGAGKLQVTVQSDPVEL